MPSLPFRPLALATAIVLLMPHGPLPTAAASADSCLDSEGRYKIPSGLILGGPDDNSKSAPYASWVSTCSFKASEAQRNVGTPYARAVATWTECMSSSMSIVERSVRTAPSSMGTPPDAVADLPSLSCGAYPDPTLTGSDGKIWKRIPVTTLSGSSGSITFSTYSYATEGMLKKTGRASTLFWGDASASSVREALGDGHWSDATPTDCSDPRYFLFGPSSKQGWRPATYDLEAHAGGTNCLEDQHHLRVYGAPNNDNGWGPWSLANVHFDKDWHLVTPGNPGVTHLHAERGHFAAGWAKVWSPTLNFYIHVYRV